MNKIIFPLSWVEQFFINVLKVVIPVTFLGVWTCLFSIGSSTF